ncbi:MAG TPA: SDR family oxidoreductase [Terriglobia bacterium]|nr:SDR family oxidoreductase [Terriglobia bacterium]
MAIYLVTGGAGFIGSHLVHELVARGEEVRVLDNFSTGKRENLEAVRDRVTIHEADITELEKIRPLFAGVDYVAHLAALSSVVRSVEDPVGTNAVNLGGTLNVLLASRDAGVKRVVSAASAAVYGNNPTLPRRESDAPDPLSPYALTKLAGEYYCRIFTRLYQLEAVALRFFNIFGPRQDPESPYTGVLSKFITAYLRGSTPVIFGNGEQSRDFTYVANVVEAVLLACRAPNSAGAPGATLNVGTGESYTLNQTIALLNRIFGREVVPRYDPPRPGDVLESRADISLARQVLGYEPKVRFEPGLRETVEWYKRTMNSER